MSRWKCPQMNLVIFFRGAFIKVQDWPTKSSKFYANILRQGFMWDYESQKEHPILLTSPKLKYILFKDIIQCLYRQLQIDFFIDKKWKHVLGFITKVLWLFGVLIVFEFSSFFIILSIFVCIWLVSLYCLTSTGECLLTLIAL